MSYKRYRPTIDETVREHLKDRAEQEFRRQVAGEAVVITLVVFLLLFGVGVRAAAVAPLLWTTIDQAPSLLTPVVSIALVILHPALP